MLEFLIRVFPAFKECWENDDLYRDSNGSFTPHGLMGAFLDFYQNNYVNLNSRQLNDLCIKFEMLVSADPADKNPLANAICTAFLELLVDTKPGDKIEPFLGRACRKFWDHYKFYIVVTIKSLKYLSAIFLTFYQNKLLSLVAAGLKNQ